MTIVTIIIIVTMITILTIIVTIGSHQPLPHAEVSKDGACPAPLSDIALVTYTLANQNDLTATLLESWLVFA